MIILECAGARLRGATAADDDLIARLLPADFDHDPTFPTEPGRALAAHRDAWVRHWLAAFRKPGPRDRFFVFVVEAGGEPVGLQTLEAPDFAAAREVESSSFLAPAARGRRLGVAMRTAVLALAFDGLGAERAVSDARPGNVASRLVSERSGYRFEGSSAPLVAGAPRPIDRYVITRAEWAALRHPPVAITGFTPTPA